MLSEDQAGPATDKPSALDVRKYDTATHAFGAPLVVQAFAQSDTGLFDGGDLAENARTGELAAVWPVSSNGSSFLRAYLSSDRGASFSPGQEIASIGSEYTIYNSARVGDRQQRPGLRHVPRPRRPAHRRPDAARRLGRVALGLGPGDQRPGEHGPDLPGAAF